MTDAGVQVFDPVRQWPYLGLSDRVFFHFFFWAKPQWLYHGLTDRGFLKSLFWPGTSVTIPWTQSVRPGSGHWRPSLNYQKKNRSGRQCYGHWRKKKPSLWDRGMASDVRMRTKIEKILRSDRQWCGHWGYKNPVYQTEVWPTELRNSVWPLAG